MPTAYLSPSLLRELTDVSVSNPGAGEAGRLLTWNGTAFVLRTSSESRTDLGLGTLATQNANAVAITGGAISGITPLPVASGGTGSNNGSITGTGALTFAAGGTNQNINLNPSGTGSVTFPRGIVNTFQVSSAVTGAGITPVCYIAQQAPWGGSPNPNYALLVEGYSLIGGFRINAADSLNSLYKAASGSIGFSTTGDSDILFGSNDGSRRLLTLKGLGNVGIGTNNPSARLHIGDITESTSTTTGAVRIDGGLGVAKNVNVGGNLRFAGGTVPATAASAGTTGDIRYDGSHLYICTATNTWRRTALSTW